MKLSPAQRHTARIAAERLLRQQQSLDSETSLHIQIVALEKDVAAASAVESRAERQEYKRDVLLPRWMPTAQAWLDGDSVHQNPVFAWCVIWLFDSGQFDQALDWAEVAILRGQETPSAFGSTFPVFVADTVLAWAEAEAAAGHDVEPYFSRTLGNVMQYWKVYDVIKAKYMKFSGLHLLRDENGEPRAAATDDRDVLLRAKGLLEQAKGFDPKCGVGTMLQRIAARLRVLEKQSSEN
ncbi:terminase [Pectobacterium parmentieri]|uniref:phage terminase small subunit n=1 Tax=Pectobacterium TaxID=122277 RepID=UPI000EB2F443|nr:MULTISPECIES: phage terminase small subunit [Pectobacterium]AYH10192.1 terminase [Pectobacterium parmentieri]AYH19097.1 terminase [Pectobacterium parmentieri]AZS56617.1 terminase [Pectobacterium parmentieri]MBQ4779060.1 terminase [Pectobacterium versatile]MBQ4783460.1 terminase [Pectobacterium versatile]